MTIQPVKALRGIFRPPSDKSLTHRAYMFGAAATGESLVRMPLTGEDCEATLRCLAQMGLRFERPSSTEIKLIPAPEWTQPDGSLDCGNSGTTMRLMSGFVASRHLNVTLIGDASLSKRPMKRIAEPLRLMGATVEGDTPPLRIKGSTRLKGIDFQSPVASGQIKGCTLIAGLRADGETWVTEPSLSRDHTERMLTALGVEVRRGVVTESLGIESFDEDVNFNSTADLEEEFNVVGWRAGVVGGSKINPFEFTVPADISSAAFFMVAAAILPTSRLEIKDLSVNPSRTGILDIFLQAGIPCIPDEEREELGEPVADMVVAAPFEKRRAFEISGSLVPRLIDEIPVLAVLATQCEGETIIRDARELRVKESDRIELVAKGLRDMGAEVDTFEDGMAVKGPVKLKGALIEANHDHRLAMAFAVAGLVAEGDTVIEGAESIATSFPGFEGELRRLSSID
ncbi:MAG: 3-phosphoshikimate 1-carboxyvinyltransferase [Chlorobia bacterium]|nr:3-phosphoshikimate 1-carboxyvinyltransferase [Fimbriimonadaceae bacterium]